MIAAFAHRLPAAPSRVIAYLRSMPPVPLAACIAAVLCSVVALVALRGGWLRPAPDAPLGKRATLLTSRQEGGAVPEAARAPGRRHCETCGVVESIRRIQPVGDVPGFYEFTVRLRDGTTRTSNDANASKWRPGDRVMLIGGDAAND